MYNQVKALESNGYSKRAIAKQLKINRRTVSNPMREYNSSRYKIP